MTALQLAPSAVALLLLAAHFYRADLHLLAVLALGLPLLLAVRAPWSRRVLQAALLAGAAEWTRTLIMLAMARSDAGQPYARLALILGAVAVFTGLAALWLEGWRVAAYYRAAARDEREPTDRAA